MPAISLSRINTSLQNNLEKSRIKTDEWLSLHVKWVIIGAVCFLVGLGLVMGTSASMDIAAQRYGDSFFFFKRQLLFVSLASVACIFVSKIPVARWRRAYPWLLLLSTVGLILVFVPGIGNTVNGSSRWVGLGPFNLQVSELSKWFLVLFVADYIVRRNNEIQQSVMSFVKPMLIVGATILLLLLEPDFGASVVVLGTTLLMLFVAGSSLKPFLAILGISILGAGLLMVLEPYRWARVIAYTDPWAQQFKAGYQLTQSLIAFGQGGIFGRGLGESVQKLFYLPEAHTDFVFAVLAEELGLLMCGLVVLAFTVLVIAIFFVAKKSLARNEVFGAYSAFGIGLLVGIQALLNIGVNTGLLPTKGLTLPLMSYGGSSILITLSMIAFVMRIEFENRKPTRHLSWIQS